MQSEATLLFSQNPAFVPNPERIEPNPKTHTHIL